MAAATAPPAQHASGVAPAARNGQPARHGLPPPSADQAGPRAAAQASAWEPVAQQRAAQQRGSAAAREEAALAAALAASLQTERADAARRSAAEEQARQRAEAGVQLLDKLQGGVGSLGGLGPMAACGFGGVVGGGIGGGMGGGMGGRMMSHELVGHASEAPATAVPYAPQSGAHAVEAYGMGIGGGDGWFAALRGETAVPEQTPPPQAAHAALSDPYALQLGTPQGLPPPQPGPPFLQPSLHLGSGVLPAGMPQGLPPPQAPRMAHPNHAHLTADYNALAPGSPTRSGAQGRGGRGGRGGHG